METTLEEPMAASAALVSTQLQCIHCKGPLGPKKQKYCSKYCKKSFWAGVPWTKYCAYCKVEMSRKKKTYCNRKCEYQARRKHDIRELFCVCGKKLEGRQIAYCGRKCYNLTVLEQRKKARIEKQSERLCEICDKPLSSRQKKYCGDKCFDEKEADRARNDRAIVRPQKEKESRRSGDCVWCLLSADDGLKTRFFGSERGQECASCQQGRRRNTCTICDGPQGQFGCVRCSPLKDFSQAVDIVLLNDKDQRERLVRKKVTRGKVKIYRNYFNARVGLAVEVPFKYWLKQRS